ncbi:MAG: alpha/beta fold hydrolase [Pseudonocardiaceae bacterium]
MRYTLRVARSGQPPCLCLCRPLWRQAPLEAVTRDRWVVVGGSWGVTLGLVYAQRHPERVIAMVLGAVTAGTRRETDWITRDMGRIFSREWEQFVGTVPAAQRGGDLSCGPRAAAG